MASVNRSAKRQLYRPATNGSVSLEQKKPKALAQGILADSNTSWQEELSRSASDFYTDDVIATSHKKKERPKPKFQNDDEISFTNEERSSHQDRFTNTRQSEESGVMEDLSALHKPNLYRNEVLIVDASGPSLNPDTSEVSTTVHKVFSPVKVICHSPSPEKQKKSYEINSITGTYDIKVNSPKQIILGTKNATQDREDSDTNENATCEQESTDKSSTIETKQQDVKQKKKKKPPRVIQSRYMIPKDPKKKQDDDSSKNKPIAHSFIHDISAIPAHSIIEGPMKGHGIKKKKAKVTSTPFNPSSWSEKTRMVADGSYLDVTKNLIAGPGDLKHDAVKAPKETKEKQISSKGHRKTGAGDSGISMNVQGQEEPVSEKQLTMKYCRMLQAMFLNAKAKNTFTKLEDEAKQQIYNVWQENQRLKSEIRQLEQTCMVKKQTMILDQLLKVQDAGLRPIDDSLDKLHNNYLTMGEALDNTRHYMPVQDIVIGNEEKLISALKEGQILLAEISSHTNIKEPGIEQLAIDLNCIVDKLYAEITEQSRCEELLIAANSMTNHERSLQSQLLQSKPVPM